MSRRKSQPRKTTRRRTSSSAARASSTIRWASSISNTSRLAKDLGGKKPATWDDLLDPAWKQKLILPDPIKTGGGYIFIATQIFRFNRDEAKAMDYMKKLHANILSYGPTSPGVITSVSNGEAAGAPNWSHDILTEKA
ncbi:MAG: extracellular solute-binding protein, partial [Chloroflexi bacterium]